MTSSANRIHAEQQLSNARRVLTHFVELYQSGKWRAHYKQDQFVAIVRQAREAVDCWTAKCNSSLG
jgi:hypothetical protein